MSYFGYKNGVWHCENVPLPQIAKSVGTPFYVYSANALIDAYREMDRAFGDMPHLICYAIKANCNLAVNRLFAKAGAAAEVVSGGELFRALKAGYPPERIVFDGNGKTPEELRQALKSGIYSINVDHERELLAIERIAAELNVSAPVAFRVNPDVNPNTHPKIATGLKKSKFGLDLESALKWYQYAHASKHLRVMGVHTHIGSQILEVSPFAEALRKIVDLALQLRELGIELDYLDIGGGLGIQYNDDAPPSCEAYVAALRSEWNRFPVKLIIEPGRSMVGNAGNLVAKVLYLKETPVKRFVVCDAAMNDLWRPSMYDAYHGIVSVREISERFTADVVGGICESGDYMARDREMSAVAEDDLIAIQSAGAYGSSMSSEYNSRPLVPEVLVEGDAFKIVRRRPAYDEMTALELN